MSGETAPMRFDQISGWALMTLQILALGVVTPALWLIGVAFGRSRLARWTSMLAAVVLGGAIAAMLLRSDEAVVAGYLFASCLFLFGTVMMAVFLLAAMPRTRAAAPGSMVAGLLLIVAFVLTYYVLATVTPLKWLNPAS
jgi:hypothetical protein